MMEYLRKRNRMEIELEQADAQGVIAAWTSRPDTVSPQQYEKGQKLLAWIFTNFQELATNFEQATSMKRMG